MMENFSFQNKNVVILIKDAILGGAERQALGFARYLIQNLNCKVSIVVTYSNQQSPDFKNFLSEIGIEKVHYFGPPSLSVTNKISVNNFKKALRAIKYLTKIAVGIRKLKPDILVPFMNGPSKIASLIYNFTGAKTTFWHQLGLEVYFHDWLEKAAVRKAPHIIANAENGLDVFKSHYNIHSEKLFVLPQYAAIERIPMDKAKLKQKFSIPSQAVVIGMVAHYRDEKYQELLLQAFAETENPDIHLVLLGSKNDNASTAAKFDRLAETIQTLNIRNKTSLLSGIPVQEVLNILDVGVLVSQIEGTPNVVMEYMLYGLPVIASNHKGCKALLGDTLFLVPNDKTIIAQKISELASNTTLRLEEGARNLTKIKNYSPEAYFKKLESILNSEK